MDKVKISIIIPVYNSEEFLDRCIQSVLDQEFSLYEVILVDDGSTDASPLLCDKYSSSDPRIITVHQENKGVSAARNAGLNIAQGEYVMFLDSDDVLLPYCLESMLDSLAEEDVVIGGYGVFVNGVPRHEVKPLQTVTYKGHDYPKFFENNITPNCELLDAPWAKLYKTKAIEGIYFNENLSYAEDKLFVFEVLSKCKSVLTVSNAVYGYYKREGSLGSDISSDEHIGKLMAFLPEYIPVVSALCERCPSIENVQNLYHNDVVGRYLCRILNIFCTRESEYLNEETIAWIYNMMDADKNLGVFSLRFGQIPNLLLYKRRKPSLTVSTYKFVLKVKSLFR